MSYSRNALSGAPSVTYPSGTQMAAGFQVSGLDPSQAAAAVGQLASAFVASFPMGTIAPSATSGADAGRATKGWGPAYGVPTGRLYFVVRTNRDGVTGDEVLAAFGEVARDLQRRLGLTVRNTNAHALGGAAPLPSPAATLVDPSTWIPSVSFPGASMMIGGVVAGSIALVAIGWALMRRRPVTRNRGKRRRR